MPVKSQFERDFKNAKILFPKLVYTYNTEHGMWCITGQLDICDVKGVYWDTFDIILVVPKSYPYCIPLLMETSKLIPREIDWHISPEGFCCMDVEHNLIAMSKRGINLANFIKDKVYSFFANQLYKLETQHYAGAEYEHHVAGVLQYYREKHNISKAETVLIFLDNVLSKTGIGRNEPCPCGSGHKIKNCHLEAIDTMKLLGDQKLKRDKENILKHIDINNIES